MFTCVLDARKKTYEKTEGALLKKMFIDEQKINYITRLAQKNLIIFNLQFVAKMVKMGRPIKILV